MSRLLGFGITFGSAFLFVPQILKIHVARSGTGISLISQFLALLSAGVICAYSYEKQFVFRSVLFWLTSLKSNIFSQWGDSLAVFIQITIIIMQIIYFKPRWSSYAFAFMAFIWMLSTAVIYHHIPFYVIQTLQTAVIPLITVSKVIFKNSFNSFTRLRQKFLEKLSCAILNQWFAKHIVSFKSLECRHHSLIQVKLVGRRMSGIRAFKRSINCHKMVVPMSNYRSYSRTFS
jgi:hypothetical protein